MDYTGACLHQAEAGGIIATASLAARPGTFTPSSPGAVPVTSECAGGMGSGRGRPGTQGASAMSWALGQGLAKVVWVKRTEK